MISNQSGHIHSVWFPRTGFIYTQWGLGWNLGFLEMVGAFLTPQVLPPSFRQIFLMPTSTQDKGSSLSYVGDL